MSKVITVLRDARKYIEKGWTQGAFHNRLGNQHTYCALGAIRRASGGGVDADRVWGYGEFDSNIHRDAMALVERAIAKKQKKHVLLVDIPRWNDWHGRKQEDVVKIFDAAIEIAEKEATPAP